MSSVHSQVTSEFVGSCESLWAVGPSADMWFFTGVCSHVGFEVIRSGELPLADLALERSHPCVLSAVSSQLV
jgi:hypothetical protein